MKHVGELARARAEELERARSADHSPAASFQSASPRRGSAKDTHGETTRRPRGKRYLYKRLFAIGVLPVPNYFLDEIMAMPLPDSHFKVLLLLWRKTIGRWKTKDWIALSQIQKGAGVNPERAVQAGEFWAEVGLFDRQRTGKKTDYKLNLWAALEGRETTVQRVRETLAAKRMLGVKGYSRRRKLVVAAR